MGSVASCLWHLPRTRDRTHVLPWQVDSDPLATREVPQRNQFDNTVALPKILQWPPCYTCTTIQFLTGAYEALHHVAPAYVVHEASAILAFHFLQQPKIVSQGPSS